MNAEEIWDGEHETSTQWLSKTKRRGRCTCGWRGRWRRGARAGWEATADADEHYNNET